ncbi:uncharacterized protein LOC117639504 isoform X2 [Thrips palmi]|uniref:Uncharacterized protein LOC117639504 isoform X2 n=2 Tax=Thrips palmi TaxID=161013 RepID=A0A6P8YBF5_THRPL|nr:uncharacterized protein LOC117639504 isoform X2 [Thrips palmi]
MSVVAPNGVRIVLKNSGDKKSHCRSCCQLTDPESSLYLRMSVSVFVCVHTDRRRIQGKGAWGKRAMPGSPKLKKKKSFTFHKPVRKMFSPTSYRKRKKKALLHDRDDFPTQDDHDYCSNKNVNGRTLSGHYHDHDYLPSQSVSISQAETQVFDIDDQKQTIEADETEQQVIVEQDKVFPSHQVSISADATSDCCPIPTETSSKIVSSPSSPVSNRKRPVSILKHPATSKVLLILKKPACNATSITVNQPTNQQIINGQQPEEPALSSTSTPVNKPTNQQTINEPQPAEPVLNLTSTPIKKAEQHPENMVLQAIQNLLPRHWSVVKENEGLHITLHSRDLARVSQRSLFISFSSGEVQSFAHGHKLLPDQTITPLTAATHCSFVEEVSSLISRFRKLEICNGINKPQFRVLWKNSLDTCHIDNNDFHETRYTTTLRSNSCKYLIDQPKKFCDSCQKVSAKLLKKKTPPEVPSIKKTPKKVKRLKNLEESTVQLET